MLGGVCESPTEDEVVPFDSFDITTRMKMKRSVPGELRRIPVECVCVSVCVEYCAEEALARVDRTVYLERSRTVE